MAATRTGVSTLRNLCRAMAKLVAKFLGVLLNDAVPPEIGLAVGALIAACLASEFDDTHAGEITGQGVTP